MNPIRLFVYGSLRSDLGEFRPHESAETFAFLAANAESEGPANVSGRLYAPAWYPGLIPGPEGEVRGELWRLASEDVFGWLDAFEGEPYARETVTSRFPDGREVTAHTYRHIASLAGVPLIPSGDYLDWVRTSS